MGLTDPADSGVYLVRFGDKAALIDAGSGRDHEQIVGNIAKCLESSAQLEYILLTHCHYDHTAGAQALKNEFGCQIVAHELDAVYLEKGDDRVTGAVTYGSTMVPLPVDIKLQEKESTLSVGTGTIKALHCPGHSPGSVVYTTELEGELILFGQDLSGPLHSDYLSDEEQYLASLAIVESLGADILLEGHFGIIEPKREVQDFIDSCITPRLQPCRC